MNKRKRERENEIRKWGKRENEKVVNREKLQRKWKDRYGRSSNIHYTDIIYKFGH